ncbi:transposase [Flavobacteriaceae bacterium]|jgi:putative transposase|nr:transposase [Flavobacteriaceae bacterium]
MSRKYKFHNESGAYFISFATVYWLDVFTRQVYFNVLEESIDYCRAEKGMEVFAYCFMPSHVHLIFRSSNVKQRQFWQQHNKPIELWSEKVIQQKIDYIHNNPVESGFVTDPVDWKYSSARNYQEDQTVLEIDI